MASHPEGDPWVLVADVLAEAGNVDPSRSFDTEARALAKTMRGVRHDWAGRPCITWSTATELLDSLRAEAARKRAQLEERLVEADRVFRASLPAGIPVSAEVPGLTPAMLMMAADPERQGSRRRSVVEDALAHAGTVFTPIRDEQAN
jgi:hypothetical protein